MKDLTDEDYQNEEKIRELFQTAYNNTDEKMKVELVESSLTSDSPVFLLLVLALLPLLFELLETRECCLLRMLVIPELFYLKTVRSGPTPY